MKTEQVIPEAKESLGELDVNEHLFFDAVKEKVSTKGLSDGEVSGILELAEDIFYKNGFAMHKNPSANSDFIWKDIGDEWFARQLAGSAVGYVNDAFGATHRKHASIDAITKYLPSYAGFLVVSRCCCRSEVLL